MHGLRWLILAAALLAACDLSIELDPGDGAERRGGRTEAQWRAEARSLEQRIEQLEASIERKREEIWSLPASFDRSVSAREESLERQIERYEEQAEALEDELGALQHEARRADVPPGWLR